MSHTPGIHRPLALAFGCMATAAGCLLVATAHLSAQTAPAAPRTTRAVSFGPDFRIGDKRSFSTSSQFEPAIAANPTDPNNLVSAFFESTSGNNSPGRFAFTTNGGLTWTVGGATPLPSGVTTAGTDPSVAADAAGNFYYASFAILSTHRSALVIAKSTDGGRTFPTSVAISAFNDKPYLAVDAQPRSLFKGNIYVSYDDFGSGGIGLVASRDGGSTFSAPLTLPDSLGGDGSVPVVAPDGTVYDFYIVPNFVLGGLIVRFNKSTDGGLTWSPGASVASGLPSPGYFDLQNSNPKSRTTPGTGILATSFPTAAAGPDGTLYVAWNDFPNGSCLVPGNPDSPCFNSDVRLSLSRNGGKSWSAPVKVTDETNATDQFFPWIATHPDGLLSIMWLDRRLDPNNENYDAFYTNTYDGVHFLPNVRVTSVTSLIGSSQFIGDYNGIAATGTGVFPIWNDNRLNTNTIFTAAGTLAL